MSKTFPQMCEFYFCQYYHFIVIVVAIIKIYIFKVCDNCKFRNKKKYRFDYY